MAPSVHRRRHRKRHTEARKRHTDAQKRHRDVTDLKMARRALSRSCDAVGLAHSVPAELACRAPLMIVGAAHVAFVDLGLNFAPRCATSEQLAYVRGFGCGILMIELQDDRVRLATVNTGMRAQIFTDPFLVTVSLGGILVLAAQHKNRAMLGVVVTKIRPTT